MNVLSLDTSTEVLSLALRRGQPPVTATASRETDGHAAVLMTQIDALLRAEHAALAEVDLVVCTRGPGSFTGLRIGMATAKGLAQAILAARGMRGEGDRAAPALPPLVSIPTLDAMAWHVASLVPVALAVIDARKGRFYAALFVEGKRSGPDMDLDPSDIAERAARVAAGRPVVVTGAHSLQFTAAVHASQEFLCDPASRLGCAAALLDLGVAQFEAHGYDDPDAGPEYVRGSDARLPG